VKEAAALALNAVRRHIGRRKVRVPRVIPVPKKIGGALPLIPILAGISAIGGAASGVSSIVKAIGDIIDTRKKFNSKNDAKKQIGNGLYLAPYRKNGVGLYLSPYHRAVHLPKN
jgi:hypothetical protein